MPARNGERVTSTNPCQRDFAATHRAKARILALPGKAEARRPLISVLSSEIAQ
jgi:hypothetical protein